MRPDQAARSPASTSARPCARRSRRGLLVKGGGHAMAAGVTVEKHRLGELRAFLEERLGEAVARSRAEASLAVDAAMTAAAATPDLAHKLEAAGPYGSGNPEPLFVLPRHRLADVMAGRRRPSPGAGRRRRRLDGRGDRLPLGRQEARRRADAAQAARRSTSPGRCRSSATAAASGRSSGWSTWRRFGRGASLCRAGRRSAV